MRPAGARERGEAGDPGNLTIGLAEIRADDSAYLARVMAIVGLKELIWRYVDVAKPVELAVTIVTPATSEYNSSSTPDNMLAGKQVWATKPAGIPAHQVESVILSVAARSRVTSFDVASYWSSSMHQMCVEEVAADGTIGTTLIAWNHYGTRSGRGETSRAATPPPRSRWRRRRRASRSPPARPSTSPATPASPSSAPQASPRRFFL